MHKLTIMKQASLNDLLKISNKFTINDGDVFYLNYKYAPCREDDYDNCSYFIKGLYKNSQVMFYIKNDDEILMETDLDIKSAYELHIVLTTED